MYVCLQTASGPCAPGYYCPPLRGRNATTASPPDFACPTAHYCAEATITPTPCSPGTYSALEGQSVCRECPAGVYCPAESQQGTPCPPHHYCLPGSSLPRACPDGSYNNETGTPVAACVSGDSNCFGGIEDGFSTAAYIRSVCVPCSTGDFCAAGMVRGTCAAGFFCNSGSPSPVPGLDDASAGNCR